MYFFMSVSWLLSCYVFLYRKSQAHFTWDSAILGVLGINGEVEM